MMFFARKASFDKFGGGRTAVFPSSVGWMEESPRGVSTVLHCYHETHSWEVEVAYTIEEVETRLQEHILNENARIAEFRKEQQLSLIHI